MAWGQVLGSLVGATGQVAGGYLGQTGSQQGNNTQGYYDPYYNPNFISAANDAARLVGGQGVETPTELQGFMGRVEGLNLDNKRKSRGRAELLLMRDQIEAGNETDFSKFMTRSTMSVLGRLGMNVEEYVRLVKESKVKDTRNRAQQEELRKANFATQRDRSDAAAGASALLGDAGRYIRGGQAGAFQTGVLDRLNQGLDEQEEDVLLKSNFGGFQPGDALNSINKSREWAPQTALEQALAAAAGLTSGLGGGLNLVQGNVNSNNNALSGAAQIFNQQAQAANALRQNQNQFDASSLANGIGTGSAALGTGISNATAAFGASQPNTTQTTSNPGYSSGNQVFGPNYVGNNQQLFPR
jgi:hypothetical protein